MPQVKGKNKISGKEVLQQRDRKHNNETRKHKKKNKSGMTNTLSKVKNTLQRINSGADDTEDQIRDL